MIISMVTGPRRHSDDLMQVVLELPCKYALTGSDDVTKMAHRLLYYDEHDGVSKLHGIVNSSCHCCKASLSSSYP